MSAFQGDVWLCMEVMDTSLDKFYKMVYDNGHKIPEEVLGKIALAVSRGLLSRFNPPNAFFQ